MIHVLAGVNGAGKSAIGGAAIRQAGGTWFNPDAMARDLHLAFPEKSITELNSQVWHEGRARLEAAIRHRTHFAFETTLGGQTITRLLHEAIANGIAVNVWYCGLQSPELHIERVAARVARGGHDIPIDLIRQRWQHSMANLCRLTPGLNQLAVYDNSRPLDSAGKPQIQRLLHVRNRQILELADDIPDWAKPVAAVCLHHAGSSSGE